MNGPIHRFLFDEMISVPAFERLRTEGVDVIHVAESSLRGAPDPEVFEYARKEGRILVTRNYQDFAPLVAAYANGGRSFVGVLFVSTAIAPQDVGSHVRALRAWLERHHESNPIQNTFGWLR